MSEPRAGDGLGFIRFILVWSSLSPVFVLWAIKGVDVVDDKIWIPACLALFLCPTLILCEFLRRAKKSNNVRTVDVVSSRDQREHLLTYLFAMLIPLFDANLGGFRSIAAISIAFIFVMFLFWHMRLHYMNLIFAVFGYRIYTVDVKVGALNGAGKAARLATYVAISRRSHIPENEPLTGYRLGANVLVDKDKDD